MHPAAPIEGRPGIQFVDKAHQSQVLLAFLARTIVEHRSIEPDEFTLPPNADIQMIRFDQKPLVLN
jgi:hypothetical protein